MSQNKKTDLCVILKKFVILYRKTRILKMKDIGQKIAAFEYAMYQLINWYKESVSTELRNIETHFTRLTSLKLLFLLASVKNLARQNQDLLNQFDLLKVIFILQLFCIKQKSTNLAIGRFQYLTVLLNLKI